MTQQIQDIKLALDAIKRALTIETEGRRFYREAAKTTQDKTGKEIFTSLASDELNHYNLLKSQYKSLQEKGDWVVSPEVQKVSIDLTIPLFPRGLDGLKNTVNARSTDWNALRFALDIEIRTHDLYRKASAQINDALGKQILEYLAEQEMEHFNTLMMRYESLFGPIAWWD